jgi:hypothetical protein
VSERCRAANYHQRAARARLRHATPALPHEKADSAVRVAAHQGQNDDVILVALEPVDGAHLKNSALLRKMKILNNRALSYRNQNTKDECPAVHFRVFGGSGFRFFAQKLKNLC